jgi:hypothetical protein
MPVRGFYTICCLMMTGYCALLISWPLRAERLDSLMVETAARMPVLRLQDFQGAVAEIDVVPWYMGDLKTGSSSCL